MLLLITLYVNILSTFVIAFYSLILTFFCKCNSIFSLPRSERSEIAPEKVTGRDLVQPVTGGWIEATVGFFSQVTSGRTRGNSLSVYRGRLSWILGKKNSLLKGGEVLEQAAQRGRGGITIPGITIPGSVQEVCRCPVQYLY